MYCTTCGTDLKPGARFCRACGSPQAAAAMPRSTPAAPLAPPVQVGQPVQAVGALAGALAILGGVLLLFLTFYASVYEPIHYHYSVDPGTALRIWDAYALAAAAVAIAIGVLLLTNTDNPLVRGRWLLLAGAPLLVISLLWTFPDVFDTYSYADPYLFGHLYGAEFGRVVIGSDYLQVPLIGACLMLIAAGMMVPAARRVGSAR
jgi:hypothetical protein